MTISILLVFVHGFLGSHESFHELPKHVAEKTREKLGEFDMSLEWKCYPAYETRGKREREIVCKPFQALPFQAIFFEE
jgi:hypothetical protein